MRLRGRAHKLIAGGLTMPDTTPAGGRGAGEHTILLTRLARARRT